MQIDGLLFFVIVIAIVVVIVLMVKVVPTFTSIFDSYGSELPLITRILIAISNFFRRYTPILAVIATIFFIIYKIYSKTEHGRLNLAKLALKLPVLGNVNELNAPSHLKFIIFVAYFTNK